MRRKLICSLMCLTVICSMSGCGSTKQTNNQVINTSSTVQKVLDSQVSTDETSETSTINITVSDDDIPEQTPGTSSQSVKQLLTVNENIPVDVDLTQMNSTMVYSEVYDMMTNPDNYIGKKIRMNGQFIVTPVDGKNYFACLIADATSCCAQGMEFQLAGEHKYPEDYPDIQSEITVNGVFETYMEDDLMYCRLADAVIE